LRRVGAAQDGVHVGQGCGFGDAVLRRFCEYVAGYFEAAAAFGGVAFEFGFDPVSGGVDALAGR